MNFTRTVPLIIAAVIGLVSTPNFAQAQKDGPDKPERREKRRAGEDRQRPERGKSRIMTPEERLKMIEAEIELDETQREQITDVLRSGQARIKQVRDDMRPTEAEIEEMKAVRQQWQEARESGDQDRIEAAREARQAFMQQRKARMDEIREKTLAEEEAMKNGIREHLDHHQLEKFDGVWTEIMDYSGRFGPRDRDARNARGMDARRMRRIVDGLKGLSPSQKKEIDGLFAAHREKARVKRQENRERDPEAERGDGADSPEGRKGRGGKGRDGKKRGPRHRGGDVDGLATDIMKVLNEEQGKAFQAEIDKAKAKRGDRRGKNERRKGGPDEDRRPPPPPADGE